MVEVSCPFERIGVNAMLFWSPPFLLVACMIDYKWARGFDPALIHSVHYICNKSLQRAVSQFLDYETESNFELTDYLMQRSVVGSKGKSAAST